MIILQDQCKSKSQSALYIWQEQIGHLPIYDNSNGLAPRLREMKQKKL